LTLTNIEKSRRRQVKNAFRARISLVMQHDCIY
jgi:hypothetical protein